MSGALQAVFQNQRSFGPPPGSQSFLTAGNYTWVAPSGITSVSVVAVGAGGTASGYAISCCVTVYPGGGGGALAYVSNTAVTPGCSYSVVVSQYTCARNGAPSSFNGCTVKAGNGGKATSGAGGLDRKSIV